jgi:hypothetical protein
MTSRVQAAVFLELLKFTICIFSDIEITKCSTTLTKCKCRSLLLTATVSPRNLNRFMLLNYNYKYLDPLRVFWLKICFLRRNRIHSCDVSEECIVWPNSMRPQTLRSISHTEKLKSYLTGLIPQSLQLQMEGTLSSLGWCHKSRECVKACACRSVCFCSQSDGNGSTGLLT